ncbi:MAG: signal peptidase I [Lachnospiraceae bacterium]|nr:signal peptidase I [Lachnospiraceae bacterium]
MNGKIKQTAGRTFSLFGLLMMVAVIIGCIPVTVPQWFGYQIYHITSGSMEPEIPTGSIILAKEIDPIELQPRDVIVFYGGQGADAAVTHRVVENQRDDRKLVTKGDANAGNDVLPVPYQNVVGRMEWSIPALGFIVPIFASTQGKLSLLAFLAAGFLFRIVGGRLMDTPEE